jgi:MYXO-CTERM domain-containing protein
MRSSRSPIVAVSCLVLSFAGAAHAGDVSADPSTFQAALGTLKPGDTLHLAAGTYPHLTVSDRNGTAASPIVVEGAAGGATVIEGDASHNTVEIVRSSYLVVRGLTVDSKGIDGVFGVSAKDGATNVVHHVTIEKCHFVGQNANQQTVAISTKTPTWGWILRANVIDGAGTGLYLGNSDGSYPFVAGVIEGNVIRNTIGYNGQIKFQTAWPTGLGLPTGPNRTVVRNNVFIKNDQPSPDGDRPNLLIGGGPTAGPGSTDLYEIYGNFFFHNPREALLQVAGRVTIHDNVFVDASSPAIVAQNHDVPLAMARIYHNTIYTKNGGIHFGSAATESSLVMGNLVFAATPVDGTIGTTRDNLVDAFANAASYVASPSFTLGAMDFYPRAGKATGTAIDVSAAAADTDYDKDFNGTSKGAFLYRGAYAGEGKNPGWAPVDGPKGGGSSAPVDAGPTADASTSEAGSDAGASDDGGGDAGATGGGGESAGCGCRHAPTSAAPTWASGALLALGWLARRRRRAHATTGTTTAHAHSPSRASVTARS